MQSHDIFRLTIYIRNENRILMLSGSLNYIRSESVAFNLLTILVYQESFLDQLVVLGLSLRRRNIYVDRTQNLLSLIVILVLFLKTSQ